jgi:uncharacterized membrane protein YtjA (UPF0391 family)
MLGAAILFFLLAIVAVFFGFTGIAGISSTIAWVLLALFVVLFILSAPSLSLRSGQVLDFFHPLENKELSWFPGKTVLFTWREGKILVSHLHGSLFGMSITCKKPGRPFPSSG